VLLDAFADDLAAVHLLSKFAEQKNESVVRLFKRLHDPLLEVLFRNLQDYRGDMRRSGLLVDIIATIEKQEDALRAAIGKNVSKDDADKMIGMLVVRSKSGSRLSSETIRDNLHRWVRD
jgi:hypothetical protein